MNRPQRAELSLCLPEENNTKIQLSKNECDRFESIGLKKSDDSFDSVHDGEEGIDDTHGQKSEWGWKTERRSDEKVCDGLCLPSLPSETLLHIFSFMDKNEQLRMSAVCKTWRQLIFSSPQLWRRRQLTLRCSRHSKHSRNAYFYARHLGRYLHKLSVACEHPNNHSCRSMAICFRKLLMGLKTPFPSALRSFKVTDLRLRFARASVLLDISTALERFIYSLNHLQCFHMSNAHWPAQEGLKVMKSVLTSCPDSLHTLRIDGFFLPRFVPPKAADVLTTGLSSLTCLSKLSIDYFYLCEQSVVALASSRRGQLRVLKLVACDVNPHSRFVPRAAWLALSRACPSMRVKVAVQGFTVSPAQSLPLLLSPAFRLHNLRLDIGNQFTFLDMPRLNMAAVLAHVTRHFRRRLTRFEMDIDNHNDTLDAALVRMVRKCRNLVSVKVTAYFSQPETDAVVRDLVRARRDKHLRLTRMGSVGTGSDDTNAPEIAGHAQERSNDALGHCSAAQTVSLQERQGLSNDFIARRITSSDRVSDGSTDSSSATGNLTGDDRIDVINTRNGNNSSSSSSNGSGPNSSTVRNIFTRVLSPPTTAMTTTDGNSPVRSVHNLPVSTTQRGSGQLSLYRASTSSAAVSRDARAD
ncbi:F-box only protein 39 [Plakobranchus ocellatus]|uniref:F-box only protein 39 n=1 Tax=Plakobranchus ocellatus TaxID=259542 RepID=A0AAV4BHD9_9GAST|nr:F-box only protein 39 [Plakobranchus ocellatus]